MPAIDAWRTIRLEPAGRRVYLPSGVHVDLGGIAKGWAAEQASRRLSKHGPALVDAGGDIVVSGPMADGHAWPIDIADPLEPDHAIAQLNVDHGAVATSGRDYRRWQRDGRWQHHILDPRTAQPARTDVLTATVVAGTAWEAEAAAKTVRILGSHAGWAWLEARPALGGLLVLEGRRVVQSSGMQRYL
jgi:thiamine biosynthesis lipoprotein